MTMRITRACGEPVPKCVRDAEHQPPCTCARPPGHHGPHMIFDPPRPEIIYKRPGSARQEKRRPLTNCPCCAGLSFGSFEYLCGACMNAALADANHECGRTK